MKKILLFCLGDPKQGWRQELVINFKESLEKRYNVKVIYLSNERTILDEDYIFIKCEFFSKKMTLFDQKIFKDIFQILYKENPDIIISQGFNIPILKAMSKYKKENNLIKNIVVFHDYFACCLSSGNSIYYQNHKKIPPICEDMKIGLKCIKCLKNKITFFYKYLTHKNIKKYLHFIDYVVSPSKHLAENLKKYGYKNVKCIHNGINLDNWKYYGYKDYDPNLFLFVGSIGKNKGVYNLLYAFEKFHKKYSYAKLYYIGGGEKEKLKREINKLSLSKNVKIIGKVSREKLVDYYSKCRCLVVPSICIDNFPTVILETMAIGKTVIGSNFGGPKEIIEESKGGFVFNPFDVNEFSYALERAYLLDEKTLIKYGKNGRNWIEENCSIEKYFESFIKIIG